MTNLKPVTEGLNRFCGPAVLSILTGRSTDECANVISQVNGSYNVAGVQLRDLLKAAERLGFDTKSIEPQGSLYRTLISLVNDDGMYIVTVPKHFVCIEVKEKKIYFCDNHTKEPIPAGSSARLAQNVVAINKVFERPKPKLLSSEIKVYKDVRENGSINVQIRRENKYDIIPDGTENVASFMIKDDIEYSNFVNKIYRSLLFNNEINNR